MSTLPGHHLQFLFAKLVNNPILSDINLVSTKTNNGSSGLDSSEVLSIPCHWDIIRARCKVIDNIYHQYFCKSTTLSNSVNINMNENNAQIDINVKENTLTFHTSFDALLIIIRYLYTGVFRNASFSDISIVKDLFELANVLQLPEILSLLNGKYVCSRKSLLNSMEDEIKENEYFFNVDVLFEKSIVNVDEYQSQQRIIIDGQLFVISKAIFYTMSKYFEIMFGSNFMEATVLLFFLLIMKYLKYKNIEQ